MNQCQFISGIVENLLKRAARTADVQAMSNMLGPVGEYVIQGEKHEVTASSFRVHLRDINEDHFVDFFLKNDVKAMAFYLCTKPDEISIENFIDPQTFEKRVPTLEEEVYITETANKSVLLRVGLVKY